MAGGVWNEDHANSVRLPPRLPVSAPGEGAIPHRISARNPFAATGAWRSARPAATFECPASPPARRWPRPGHPHRTRVPGTRAQAPCAAWTTRPTTARGQRSSRYPHAPRCCCFPPQVAAANAHAASSPLGVNAFPGTPDGASFFVSIAAGFVAARGFVQPGSLPRQPGF